MPCWCGKVVSPLCNGMCFERSPWLRSLLVALRQLRAVHLVLVEHCGEVDGGPTAGGLVLPGVVAVQPEIIIVLLMIGNSSL